MEGFIIGALTSVIVSLGYYGFKKLEDKQSIKIRLIVFGAVFAILVLADIIISCVDGTCAMSLVFVIVFGWRFLIDMKRFFNKKDNSDKETTDTTPAKQEEETKVQELDNNHDKI